MNLRFHNTSAEPGKEPESFPLRSKCSACGKHHWLPAGSAMHYCRELMAALDHQGGLDLFCESKNDPSYSTAPLFGEARGKMFGVLEGVDPSGKTVILYAFSGQFNGLWTIPGWAPPLFCETTWQTVNRKHEAEIKKLTAEIAAGGHTPEKEQILKQERKKYSQWLMNTLHALYSVGNFKGERANLNNFYCSSPAPPTGAGDCCAPKLLNLAQKKSILPLSIAEFYWGRTNRSETRHHGRFYPACTEKCGPLLGFMLCGLEEQLQDTICTDETALQ